MAADAHAQPMRRSTTGGLLQAQAVEERRRKGREQVRRAHLEGAAETQEDEESWLLIARLQTTHVVLVEVCCFGERLLGEAALFAVGPDGPSEMLECGGTHTRRV